MLAWAHMWHQEPDLPSRGRYERFPQEPSVCSPQHRVTIHASCRISHVAAGVVEDLNTGEYRAAFCATAAGVYVVAAQLGGRNIAGSPFAAAVAPAAVCAATSAVALAPAALVAGQQARSFS